MLTLWNSHFSNGNLKVADAATKSGNVNIMGFERRMLANIRQFFNGSALKSSDIPKFSDFFEPT